MSPLNIPLKNVSKMNPHVITVTHESPVLLILFVSIGILCLVYAPGNSLSKLLLQGSFAPWLLAEMGQMMGEKLGCIYSFPLLSCGSDGTCSLPRPQSSSQRL